MWIAFVVAVLATAGNHIGKVFQKKGTNDLPQFALDWSVFKAYLGNRVWLGGFLGDFGGAVCTAVALALAPVSTVQPIISAGVVFLVVFSYFYLGEEVVFREWIGVGLSVVGAVGIGLTMAAPGKDKLDPQAALVVVSLIVVLMVVCESLFRRGKWVEFATGLQAGLGFALSAASMRTGMLLSQQHSQPLWAVAGILGSIGLSSTGFFLQTRGLKNGRAVAIGTFTNVFVLVTAVILGLVVLNEAMPQDPKLWWTRVSSCGVILLGTALMAKE